MTREEIIEQLNLIIGLIKQDGKDWLDDRDIPILEECVKALSQEPTFYPPCEDCRKKMDEIRRAYDRLSEQEPTERELGQDYLLQSCVEALKVLQAENDDLKEKLKQEPTVQDKQAESEKYQKAFDDGYANGYEQARFDYEQEPCDKCVYSTKDGYCQYDDISETIPPLEPCTDAVSRDAILEWCGDINMDVYTNEVKEFVNGLPSVNPQPCDDAISRIEVMNVISDFVALEKYIDKHNHITFEPLEEMINSLPSVTPICEEREKGECPWYA